MIDKTQIDAHIDTYGCPPAVRAWLKQQEEAGVTLSNISDQGRNAIAELKNYVAGQMVIDAIAAMAVGSIEIPMDLTAPEPEQAEATPIDDDEETTSATDRSGNEIVEGSTVTAIEGDANGRTGEVESLTRRGGVDYASVAFFPSEGYTTRDLFEVRCDWLDRAEATVAA